MVFIFVQIDTDRDASFPVKNYIHAVSKSLQQTLGDFSDPEKTIATKGTIRSFSYLLDFLCDNQFPSTFYLEARTTKKLIKEQPDLTKILDKSFFELGTHGYDHEDFQGLETGIELAKDQEYDVLKRCKNEIEDLFSTQVIGFRAPYMRDTLNTMDLLSELGYKYNSSSYIESAMAVKPIKMKIYNFPVIKTPKESSMRGMYTYLWPMFEGKRHVDEVVDNFLTLVKNSKSGDDRNFISINLHSWHFAYHVGDNRYLSDIEIEENMSMFKKLLFRLQEIENVTFSTPRDWLHLHNIDGKSED